MGKFKKLQELTDDINRVTRENITGINVVRAYNAEKYQESKFETANNNLTKTQLFTSRTMSFMMPGIQLIMSGLPLAIYWIGAYLINKADMMSKITLFSDMVTFSSYAMQIVMAFMMMVMVFIILPRASVAAKRINEVLDMSKLESEEIVLENKDFDINRLLHEIREVIEKQVYERGISLSEKEYNLKYRYLNGSPVHLKRILMNIISNAVKYNKEKGEILLSYYETQVDNRHILFEFQCKDTGVGMSKEFQNHIFEPFTQETGGARSVYGGTGLGMPITKKLIEKMGGTIKFE